MTAEPRPLAPTDALYFARKAHLGQTRADGVEPYINHCIRVVDILQMHGVTDVNVLCAAALHDTIEDGKATREEIVEKFGVPVALLVSQVTNAPYKNYQQKHANQRDAFSAYMQAGRYDPCRIKLADVLANTESAILAMPPNWSEVRKHATAKHALNMAEIMYAASPAIAHEIGEKAIDLLGV